MAYEDSIVSLSDVDMIISAGADVAYIRYVFVILYYGEVARDARSHERFIKNVRLINALLVSVSI